MHTRLTPSLMLLTLLVLGILAGAVVPCASADSYSVRSQIFEAIDREQNFGPYELEIDARMGSVVLFGAVASAQSKDRVEAIARSIAGVKSVSNQIVVDPNLPGGQQTSSGDLAKQVRDAVLARSDLSSYQLNVKSLGAAITLTGTVSRASDRDAIEQSARSVAGVQSVSNQIAVQQAATDADITASVWEALRRESSLRVEDLDVSTLDGVVTLKGARSDHRERDQILSIVIAVPGVRDVRSELH